jgi:hypothetical protein
MTERADFLRRIGRLTFEERFDAFFAETVEHGGVFEPDGAIRTIDLHGVRVDHDSTEGAMAAWARAARERETEGDLAWAVTVMKDAKSLGCERRKAAQIILAHCRDAAMRMVAQAELARLGGRAA